MPGPRRGAARPVRDGEPQAARLGRGPAPLRGAAPDAGDPAAPELSRLYARRPRLRPIAEGSRPAGADRPARAEDGGRPDPASAPTRPPGRRVRPGGNCGGDPGPPVGDPERPGSAVA